MTTTITRDKPSRLRRAAAAVALAALVAALLYLAISAIYNWYVVLCERGHARRRGDRRVVHPVPPRRRPCRCRVVAAVALAAFAVLVIATESLIVLGVGLGLAAVSIGAASYALSPVRSATDDTARSTCAPPSPIDEPQVRWGQG